MLDFPGYNSTFGIRLRTLQAANLQATGDRQKLPINKFGGHTIMNENPYDPPVAASTRMDHGSRIKRDAAPMLISAILILAVLVGVLSLFIPAIRSATMPRFGWIGLLLCLNPLIFLAIWCKTLVRRNLLAASFMICAIGLINGVVLFTSGTVSFVENEFNDRLHSSWFWAVVPFLVAGGYLYWFTANSETAG